MQSINMLLLAIMAFVTSLTCAAALASASVSHTHPTGHHGSYTGSMTGKYKPMTGWGEWSGKPSVQPSLKPTAEPSMTETGAPTTSTIHTTETEIVTARNDDHKSTSFGFGPGGLGPVSRPAPSMSSRTKTFIGIGSLSHTGSPKYTGIASLTKAASGMTTVTMAAREDAANEDGCTPVFFRGGGFCLPTAAKRGDDVMTHAHKHSHHESKSHSMTMAN